MFPTSNIDKARARRRSYAEQLPATPPHSDRGMLVDRTPPETPGVIALQAEMVETRSTLSMMQESLSKIAKAVAGAGSSLAIEEDDDELSDTIEELKQDLDSVTTDLARKTYLDMLTPPLEVKHAGGGVSAEVSNFGFVTARTRRASERTIPTPTLKLPIPSLGLPTTPKDKGHSVTSNPAVSPMEQDVKTPPVSPPESPVLQRKKQEVDRDAEVNARAARHIKTQTLDLDHERYILLQEKYELEKERLAFKAEKEADKGSALDDDLQERQTRRIPSGYYDPQDPELHVAWLSLSDMGPYAGKHDRLVKANVYLSNDSAPEFFKFYNQIRSNLSTSGFHIDLLPELR